MCVKCIKSVCFWPSLGFEFAGKSLPLSVPQRHSLSARFFLPLFAVVLVSYVRRLRPFESISALNRMNVQSNEAFGFEHVFLCAPLAVFAVSHVFSARESVPFCVCWLLGFSLSVPSPRFPPSSRFNIHLLL